MAQTFRAEIYYPGLIGVQTVDFAHPAIPTFAEMSLVPYAQPADVTHQGTEYHFPVAGTSTGNATGGHSTTHWHRAWRTVGFESIRFEGTVQFATIVGRASNASPYTAPVAFDILLTGSVPDKSMHDSIAIAAGSFAAASVNHLGEAGTGLLTTNAGMAGTEGPLGDWAFTGLSDSFTDIGSPVTVATVPTYLPADHTPGTATIVAQFSASIYGNSMCARYEDEDGNWQYPSYFVLTLKATLAVTGRETDHMFQGPDGTEDPDNSPPDPSGAIAICSTYLIGISGDSGNTPIGEVEFTSTESLSPNPQIFQDETDNYYAVPWLYNDQVADDGPYNAAEWADVVVTVSAPKYAIPPDLFPDP